MVRLPLKQNAGQPPRLCVEKGQHVRTGEKIAEASGNISAPLHASISGVIKEIGRAPVPYGHSNRVIVIEGDGKDEHVTMKGRAAPLDLSRDDLLAAIRDAGVVGMGGAEFPTQFKLAAPADKHVDTVIINAAECEPYLTVDHRLMLERSNDFLSGTRLIMRAAGVKKAYIGIEENKKDAYQSVIASLSGDDTIVPVLLRVKYPQGAEKQLIKAILNREVPSGGLPSDVGVIVQNVGTAIAVYEACALGKPLYERVVTVSGNAVRNPANLIVRIGTLFGELIEQCGGLTDDARAIIMGGPMMGIAQWTLDVPVVKGTTGIIALSGRDIRRPRKIRPCIHCGRCMEVCPMRISPSLMRRAAEKGKWDEAKAYGVLECIECGACAYVCATSRDLVQLYRSAKRELKRRSCEIKR
jgi:electron transport complex protein RnfC